MSASRRGVCSALAFAIAFAGASRAQQHDHGQMDHGRMDHGGMQHAAPAAERGELRTAIPPLTDEDRRAAFPSLARPMAHAREWHGYLLADRLEARNAGPGTSLAWEVGGWFGSDLDRAWLRTEGERHDGRTAAADVELLYGRSIARWWDVLAGVRQDFAPGDSATWAAVGLQGLAPCKFEVEATAYLGEAGRTSARLEIEYELLLTNRLILQPLVEVTLFGKADPARGVGSGLSTAEAGLRLRYEVRRRFAPYLGVGFERSFGGTADLRRADGEDVGDVYAVAGVRAWF